MCSTLKNYYSQHDAVVMKEGSNKGTVQYVDSREPLEPHSS